MGKILRSYKYQIIPTEEQQRIIHSVFDKCRFVFNRILLGKKQGTINSIYAKAIIPRYIQQYPFLKECDTSALMNVAFQLSDINDFSKVHFRKGNEYYKSYSTGNFNGRIKITENTIIVPYIGVVKAKVYRKPPEGSDIHKLSIIRDITGNYYASVLIQIEVKPRSTPLLAKRVIGLDYSQTHFYVDSDGNKADIPHFFQNISDRITREKRKLNNLKFESKNYMKQKRKIERIRKKAINQRKDCLQKLSTNLANTYDIICVEKIDLIDLKGNTYFRKNLLDNGYGIFLEMLQYKMAERGKYLVMIEKWFPSTKRCSKCGFVKDNISLNTREWVCDRCGALHDRDINAAENIKIEGLRVLKKAAG